MKPEFMHEKNMRCMYKRFSITKYYLYRTLSIIFQPIQKHENHGNQVAFHWLKCDSHIFLASVKNIVYYILQNVWPADTSL